MERTAPQRVSWLTCDRSVTSTRRFHRASVHRPSRGLCRRVSEGDVIEWPQHISIWGQHEGRGYSLPLSFPCRAPHVHSGEALLFGLRSRWRANTCQPDEPRPGRRSRRAGAVRTVLILSGSAIESPSCVARGIPDARANAAGTFRIAGSEPDGDGSLGWPGGQPCSRLSGGHYREARKSRAALADLGFLYVRILGAGVVASCGVWRREAINCDCGSVWASVSSEGTSLHASDHHLVCCRCLGFCCG